MPAGMHNKDGSGAAIQAAVDAEREACAKVAREHHCEEYDCLCGIPIELAIRARGEQPNPKPLIWDLQRNEMISHGEFINRYAKAAIAHYDQEFSK